MQIEPDGFEQSARIVEAFMADQTAEVVELLTRIVEAIRDKAVDS